MNRRRCGLLGHCGCFQPVAAVPLLLRYSSMREPWTAAAEVSACRRPHPALCPAAHPHRDTPGGSPPAARSTVPGAGTYVDGVTRKTDALGSFTLVDGIKCKVAGGI